ncbi:unnamed protein product, partial [Rotaria sp. Silwood1]
PIQSFTFSSSKQQQEISIINEAAGTTQNSISTSSRKLSDPSTPISQHSGFPNQEQEATDLPASLADISLLEKKIRTKLVDSSALVIDRSDPTSPLYSLKSFQDFNLKPELLKGNFLKIVQLKINNSRYFILQKRRKYYCIYLSHRK